MTTPRVAAAGGAFEASVGPAAGGDPLSLYCEAVWQWRLDRGFVGLVAGGGTLVPALRVVGSGVSLARIRRARIHPSGWSAAAPHTRPPVGLVSSGALP